MNNYMSFFKNARTLVLLTTKAAVDGGDLECLHVVKVYSVSGDDTVVAVLECYRSSENKKKLEFAFREIEHDLRMFLNDKILSK